MSNSIPAVKSGRALQSLRDSGYSLGAAVAEPVDNSLEANANWVGIRLEQGSKPSQQAVDRIAVADDGEGMNRDILQHYLQLGFSTRYMSEDTIGKYGVGAKLAALNYAQRIDVWSRTDGNEPWLHAHLDLEEALEQEDRDADVVISPPTEDEPADDFAELLPDGAGTLVVWSKIDRLERGRRSGGYNQLGTEVENDLARIFRYFLDGGIEIEVNGTSLLPHDPLFLMEGTWADMILRNHYTGKSEDPDEDERVKQHYEAEQLGKEEFEVDGSPVTLRVTLYPKEVIRKRGMGGDKLARKLRVPENEGSLSFVRLDREINYTNVPRIFSRAVENRHRFIGIEIAFRPELDRYFGVRNVKRGVEPHDELRSEIRDRLAKYIDEADEKINDIWGEAAREEQEHAGEHDPVVKEAEEANRTLPKGRAEGPEDEEEKRRLLEDLARDVGKDDPEKMEQYLEDIKDRPFVVESVDFPGTQFLDVQHLDGKVIIRVNTRHRFYREAWHPLREVSDRLESVSAEEAKRVARRASEALALLLIAYGKAESMYERPRERYGDLRNYWGHFLETMMEKVKGVL